MICLFTNNLPLQGTTERKLRLSNTPYCIRCHSVWHFYYTPSSHHHITIHYWSCTTVITAETWKTALLITHFTTVTVIYRFILNSSFFLSGFLLLLCLLCWATACLQLLNLRAHQAIQSNTHSSYKTTTTTIETGSRKNNLIRFVVSGVPCQVKLWLRTGWPILSWYVACFVWDMSYIYMENVCIRYYLIKLFWMETAHWLERVVSFSKNYNSTAILAGPNIILGFVLF